MVRRATEKNKAEEGVGIVSEGGQGRSLKVTGRSLTKEGASRPEDEGGSPYHKFHSRSSPPPLNFPCPRQLKELTQVCGRPGAWRGAHPTGPRPHPRARAHGRRRPRDRQVRPAGAPAPPPRCGVPGAGPLPGRRPDVAGGGEGARPLTR